MSNRNRRAQRSKAPKSGNTPYAEAMQGKRSSNAAGPHTPRTAYRRRPKHRGQGHEGE